MANLGFDFDGVIVDTKGLEVKILREHYGIDVAPENCRWEVVQNEENMTRDKWDAFKLLVYDSRLGLQLEPVDGAIDYIKMLKESVHKVKIITQRFEDERPIPNEWLGERGISKEEVPIYYTSSKSRGITSKVNYCTGLDLFVDDYNPNLLEIKDIVPNLILFTSSQNKNEEVKDSRILRVNNWEGLYNFIRTNLR